MADYVVTARIEDQTSAGANAAAAALLKYADAADQVTTITEKAGPSAKQLAASLDVVTKSAAAVQIATDRLNSATVSLSAGVAAGKITQDQASGALATLQARLAAAQAAQNALSGAAEMGADSLNKSAGAANAAGGAHAGFYREVLVLGHEMLVGNYSRIPGSIAVLAERTGNLEGIAKSAFAALTSVPGLLAIAGVAATAALVTMAVEAENANLAVARLSTQLMATRADYDSLAVTVTQAAKAFAQTPGVSSADSKTAAQTIASVPTFSGSSADLTALLTLSNQISLVWGVGLPDAAKKLADAMRDPAAAAKQLASEGFPAMSAALADSIARMEDSGNLMGAQQAVLDAYGTGTASATAHVTDFQSALHDLSAAFSESDKSGTSWGHSLGNAILGVADAAIEAAARVVSISKSAGIDTSLAGGDASAPDPNGFILPGVGDGKLHPPASAGSVGGAASPLGYASSLAAQQTAADVQGAFTQQLLQKANSVSGGSGTATSLRDQITLLKSAQDAVGANTSAWTQYQEQIDKDQKSLDKLTQTTDKAGDSLAKAVGIIETNVASQQNLSVAILAGGDAVNVATAADKAMQEAFKLFPKDASERATATEQLTQANLDLAAANAQVTASQSEDAAKQALALSQAELDMVGMTTDARNKELAVLKERDALIKANHGDESILDTDAAKAALDLVAKNADVTAALTHQRQVVSDVSSYATQAFDQVGNSIATAFTNGNGAAVNFANIFKSLISSIIQEVAKLAVINPIINSIMGSTNTTLSDVVGQVGGGGSSGGGFSLSNLSSVGSLGNSLSGGSLYSSVGSGLGMTGPGGILSTSLWSSAASETAGASTIGSISALSGADGAGAVSLGGLLGGAGAGAGAGMLVNSLLGGHQVGGDIGSLGGAAAGAAIGSIVPGVGTLIGGILGGVLGGAGGGLIGPGAPHHGWGIDLNTNSAGALQVASTSADKFDNSAQVNAVTSQVQSLNATLAAMGIQAKVVNPGSTGGANRINLGGNNGVAQPVSLSDTNVFDKLSFSSSTDSALNTALAGKSFLSATELQNFTTLVTTTIPALTTNSGSLAAQITALGNTFQAAKMTANEYGVSQDSLNTALAAQVTKVNAAAASALAYTEAGYQARIANATGDTAGGSLIAFDASAQQQRDQLTASLTATYGDAYTATADYARVTGELNTALADERAQLISTTAAQAAATAQATHDAAAATAGNTVTSLASYAQSLLVGAANPASAQSQFSAAQSAFLGVNGAAQAGNVNSISQLQTYATSYLDSARALYGSGTGYAAAFSQVVTALQAVAQQSSDTLTASVMVQQTETVVQQLQDTQAALSSRLDALALEVRQGGMTPARVAA